MRMWRCAWPVSWASTASHRCRRPAAWCRSAADPSGSRRSCVRRWSSASGSGCPSSPPNSSPSSGSAARWPRHPGAAAELRLLATTRRPGLAPVEQLLDQLLQRHADAPQAQAPLGPPPQWIRMAIGPEGGWTGDEERQAEAAGWLPVCLGDTILRTATAAVLAAGWMAAWRRRLRQGGRELSS
ncbi:MAG: 16S rRNA (uracil(1498)-N(3))-methyltransferase [Cyanobium sp. M30B3]|nr:MAG: 16S rRNA (uracil(1498)-N(3))-methyltransferase [Cyanobium sp. M30B3]